MIIGEREKISSCALVNIQKWFVDTWDCERIKYFVLLIVSEGVPDSYRNPLVYMNIESSIEASNF